MAMAQSKNKSSGIGSAMGPIGGMIPGMGQMSQISQLTSDPKGTVNNMAQEMAKKVIKKIAKQIAQKIATSILTNPYVLAAIGIGLAIAILFLIIIAVVTGQGDSSATSAQGGDQPTQSTYAFVALGDSLTAWPCDPVTFGCVDSNSGTWRSYGFTGKPWPTYLTADPNLKLLYNAGYPAQTTAYMLAQEPGVLSTYHPDVLFVLGGTNDLLNGGIKEQGTIDNLKSIISTAKSSAYGVKNVIVLTIPNQCNRANTSLNTAIKGLSTLTTVIDISSTSSIGLTCADFQSDSLHLTDAGAKAVADYINAQIKAQNIFPPPSAQPGPPPVGSPNLVFYCQWSPRASLGGGSWYSHPYPYAGATIGNNGCGPTSMAMIVSSFGNIQHPDVVGDAFENDGMVYGNGTGFWPGKNPTAIKAWLVNFGLKATDANLENGGVLNETAVSKFLSPGSSYLLFGEIENYIADSNPNLYGGHMVVITAINTNNHTITLYNPEYCHTGSHAETVSYTANIGYGGVPYHWGQIVPMGPVGQ